MGWFGFLVNECARPYQNVLTKEVGFLSSLNFIGTPYRFASKASLRFYTDGARNLYRDRAADFAVAVNSASNGKVVQRIESVYSHIFIDEVQDLVGYDLEVLDMLFASAVKVTVVGDPRQHTIATNMGAKNKKYRGHGIMDWFGERSDVCTLQLRNESYRCNQAICDFADSLFPSYDTTVSRNGAVTGHDGIFTIGVDDVKSYVLEHAPTVLRDSKATDTLGYPAVNIGVAKGSTYDRVLVFGTNPMKQFVQDGDLGKFKSPARLYVAVTRARHSVAFVI
jgi:hypothetical protein